MSETGKPNLSDLKIDHQARPSDGGARRLMLIAATILVTIAVIAILIVGGTSVTTVEVAIARAAPTGGSATVLNASGYVEPRRKATVSSPRFWSTKGWSSRKARSWPSSMPPMRAAVTKRSAPNGK
jgi:hypothetical protein